MKAVFIAASLALGLETNHSLDLSVEQILGSQDRVAISKTKPSSTVENSQFTHTLFSDGHIEEVIYYTDGTHYTYPTKWLGRLPRKGDVKHREWVWRENKWIMNVDQYY